MENSAVIIDGDYLFIRNFESVDEAMKHVGQLCADLRISRRNFRVSLYQISQTRFLGRR